MAAVARRTHALRGPVEVGVHKRRAEVGKGNAFERDKLIRFHHCDPAGIVFYPQYFILFHELVEDWFNHGLQHNYAELVYRQRLGLPMVRVECDFLSPSKIGEMLTLSLGVRRIGRSSLGLAVEGVAGGVPRVRAALTVVLADVDGLRSVAFPAELRAGIERYLTG
ncbi:MAG TPA: thioesterase family protein [Burkholderiaceae bacterium]|jgi:4-hydroxybenzoyl-CoA thioesterase|nr:thioesterase family protein [Burkholderiaceae bacterium]